MTDPLHVHQILSPSQPDEMYVFPFSVHFVKHVLADLDGESNLSHACMPPNIELQCPS
jgi:hypothetical protein